VSRRPSDVENSAPAPSVNWNKRTFARRQQGLYNAVHILGLMNAELAGEAQRTVVRDSPKIGRNDPCPCGSGKKHKKYGLAAAD
jgi:hypothetical protein